MSELTVVDRDQVVRGLNEQWDVLVELAAELTPEQWDLPTDCPNWTVRDNFAHIIGTESMLLGREAPDVEVPEDLEHVRNDIGRINEAWVIKYRDRSGAEVLSDMAEVITERRAVLAGQDQEAFDEPSWTPAGKDSFGRFMRIRIMDQWFHEQDIREAAGKPGHFEGVAPPLVLDEVASVMGYVIGKQAAVPSGSTVRLVLEEPMATVFDVEVTDRARLVDSLDGEPTVTLTIPGRFFLRVAGGRIPWDDPAVIESVEIQGDEKLGQQVLSNLKYMF